MIAIKNLTKKFGSTLSLDEVTIDFNKNDSIALMGANGAGKTTLIRSILGYIIHIVVLFWSMGLTP